MFQSSQKNESRKQTDFSKLAARLKFFWSQSDGVQIVALRFTSFVGARDLTTPWSHATGKYFFIVIVNRFFTRHPYYVKCVQTLCKMLHKLSFAANCIHCIYCYCYSTRNECLALLTSFNGFRYRLSQFCHCITTFYDIQYISISSNWKTIFQRNMFMER